MDFSWESNAGTPTLWALDLGLVSGPGPVSEASLRAWRPLDFEAGLDTLAGFGGAALALAGWKAQPAPRFALAVGRAVRAGQATASRVSVIARSPLTGHLSQAQVGSDLARRLGNLCDGILLSGVTDVPDAVLVLHAQRGILVQSHPGIQSMDTDRSAQHLREHYGDCAVLRCGPAAHAGVLWANLCAGQEPASFVGSGGLGTVLARTGIAAIVVCSEPVLAAREVDGWLQSLVRSPRLVARSQGQPLQAADRDPASPAPLQRHGCEGCPTPCGFVFERPDQRRGNARFSALRPLMDLVEDPDGHGVQELLQACNDLGVDAREAAACLLLDLRHGAKDGVSLPDRLRAQCLGAAESEAFRRGSVALAAHLGIEPPRAPGRTQTPTPIPWLAEHYGVRGSEPLRSYPFLVEQQTDARRMRDLVAPLDLPVGSERNEAPAGKGRLLWWHENLISGVDVLGVCAFTVASLLSDGVSDLPELAARVLPEDVKIDGARGKAETLLAVGANVLLLFRALDMAALDMARRTPGRPAEKPWGELHADWILEAREYQLLRGLQSDGTPDPTQLQRLGSAHSIQIPDGMRVLARASMEGAPRERASHVPGRIGVELRFKGALEARFGEALCLWLQTDDRAAQALQILAEQYPRHTHWLLKGGQPVPAILRDGQVLMGDSPLRHGDVLELLLAISGG